MGSRNREYRGPHPGALSVKLSPSSGADIAAVVTKTSQRVIRKLRKLGYLESFSGELVATDYDLLVDDEPELARTLSTSVHQRIAFGKRAGQKVRRLVRYLVYQSGTPNDDIQHVAWLIRDILGFDGGVSKTQRVAPEFCIETVDNIAEGLMIRLANGV